MKNFFLFFLMRHSEIIRDPFYGIVRISYVWLVLISAESLFFF